ncbi:TetR/AcrR family transcriptional regulator [Streptomyces endophyticus]|uniref:TetR/AcrR family transcriptional regulator n=1 Tax=Streptomyces endophyticus TaxID=714166 RepID=A0ABU6F9N7_9ACTN|nr:TetR/AcrR family transcriptional regulator [Streptomyces endophyticus]MEB8340534.1 TetR/AcrR family transcriptional regulator [Streptomyces endophyticus]
MSSTDPAPGLRERKKQRTRQTLSETAVRLFMEKGYDNVSVAEIAAAAEVSKPTLFRYFASKEDLVLHQFADHEDEAARVVAGRGEGEAPLEALRRHFLEGLRRRDPVTGLCDHPAVLAYQRLLYGTPQLVARLYGYQGRSERALAEALGGSEVRARIAAGQIVSTQRILADENVRRIVAGESADELEEAALRTAELGFQQLGEGIGRWYG